MGRYLLDRAVVDLAVSLAWTPATATTAHVDRLREIRPSELETLDIVRVAASSSRANPLEPTLGPPCCEEVTTP